MPRVHHVKAARKPIPNAGIEVGDSYYWWKFRYGGKRVSKIRPSRSQLTQSPYLSTVYQLQDADRTLDTEAVTDWTSYANYMRSMAEDIAGELQGLLDDAEESLENMPEGLREGNTGELLQERIDTLGDAIAELDQIDFDRNEDANFDDVGEAFDEHLNEINAALENL